MKRISGLLLVMFLAGCAARTVNSPQRFVPVSGEPVTDWADLGPLDESAWDEGRVPVSTEANWTRLGPGPGQEPGVLMVMAHAGLGDRFPVRDKDGRTHFVVIVADGDDQRLNLVIHSKEGVERFEVGRDTVVPVVVDGGQYELLFPTTSVAADADAKPSTDKPLIIVRHRTRPESG